MDSQTSPELVIEELLDQNSALRLELATLNALYKQTQNEPTVHTSNGVPQEAIELLSKLDIR